MLKKLLFYTIIITCCFIHVSCEKKSQSRESNAANRILSIAPTQAPMGTTTVTPSIDIFQTISTELSQTCLQDKKHNVFIGTIGTEEICMDIYPDGNNINAFYVNKNNENDIKLVGSLDRFEISLTSDSKDTLTGNVSSAGEPNELKGTFTQSNGEKLPVVLKMDHACGDSPDHFYDYIDFNSQEVDAFLFKLKKDILSADKKAVAQSIYYPVKVSMDGKDTTINSSLEFIKNYSKIMNQDFVNAISTAYTKYVFYNAYGIMFGGHELNVCIYKMGNELKIIGINNVIIPRGLDTPIAPMNTSEPFTGSMAIDSATENFLYGTWQIEKLLGFADSWNDASEYPTGQKVIGDKIVIKKNLFNSKGLENYIDYQYITRDPLYEIETICYNSDSFYRLWKINLPGLHINDEVKSLEVFLASKDHGLSIPLSLLVVNNNRLILMLEATCFELKKVDDKTN